jgi:hypothetical protein
MTTCQQRPQFWGPEGGRYLEVDRKNKNLVKSSRIVFEKKFLVKDHMKAKICSADFKVLLRTDLTDI